MLQTFKTKLIKKTQLTHDIYLLEFKLTEPERLEFKAGQYMMLLCPQSDGTNLRRLYSIASNTKNHDTFQLVAEIIPNGVASNYFLSMNINDTVDFQGPAGMFILKRSHHRVFLATGTGIAPMRSMLKEIIHGDEQTEHANFLFWGVQHLEDIYFLDELKSFTKEHPSFEFFICLSREENLNTVNEEERKHFVLGRVTVGLEKRLGKNILGEAIDIPKDFDYYLCGGRTVIESLRQYLNEKGMPKEQVMFEKF